MLHCADRREVRWLLYLPVLDNVAAHDVVALARGHPRAVGNDLVDAAACVCGASEEDQAHVMSRCPATVTVEWLIAPQEMWVATAQSPSVSMASPPVAVMQQFQFPLLAALLPPHCSHASPFSHLSKPSSSAAFTAAWPPRWPVGSDAGRPLLQPVCPLLHCLQQPLPLPPPASVCPWNGNCSLLIHGSLRYSGLPSPWSPCRHMMDVRWCCLRGILGAIGCAGGWSTYFTRALSTVPQWSP